MNAPADLYEIMGITPNASLAEIKKAYRALALQNHPDHNPSDDAKTKWAQIQKAYEILADPVKKLEYDQGKKSAITTKPRDFLRDLWDIMVNRGLKS
ncbi:MAG: DnaJ domain-containing protein [Candidatus Parcubacteria bacterium]|nr:DnaJ domain-containing protein [Candidatus Parcubacteria bacterium]